MRKKSACGRLIDHGVLGGTLKSTTNDKLHKMHAQKSRGVFFAEKTTPLWDEPRPRGAGRDPEIDENRQT